MILIIYNRQLIQLIIPDDIIGRGQRCILIAYDQFLPRRHEIFDKFSSLHPGNTIVTACDDAKKFA